MEQQKILTINASIAASGTAFRAGDRSQVSAVDHAATAFVMNQVAVEGKVLAEVLKGRLRQAYGCKNVTAQGETKYDRHAYACIKLAVAVAARYVKETGVERVREQTAEDIRAALEQWRSEHDSSSLRRYEEAMAKPGAAKKEPKTLFESITNALEKRGEELTEGQLRTLAEKLSARINAIQADRERAEMRKAQAEELRKAA